MKQKISVLLCILCISLSYTLNLEAKFRHHRLNDPVMNLYPMDPDYFDDEFSFPNRNHVKIIDFQGNTAISDTDNVLKAVKELLTYKATSIQSLYNTSDVERLDLFEFHYKKIDRILYNADECYRKLRNLAKAMGHYKKFSDLFFKNNVFTPDQKVIALMKEANWTQNEIPNIILDHMNAQHEIIEAYKDKYGSILDELCDKYVGSSDCQEKSK